jgi:glucosamine 6-phosphate synthetase-like amidotransferase/phosphosugar isomerase protein
MCGIVAYFGGAGNHLTRVLTGMSAITYRAPDSTGIGLFGDESEPIRTRKSLGAVRELVDGLVRTPAYPDRATQAMGLGRSLADPKAPAAWQHSLLTLEGLPVPDSGSGQSAQAPGFDDLVALPPDKALRLYPGACGYSGPMPVFTSGTNEQLAACVEHLVNAYDLSPVAVHSLYRRALVQALENASDATATVAPEELLALFDQVMEGILTARNTPLLFEHPGANPRTWESLWTILARCPLALPEDYDRDGVRGLFRVLDGALLSCLPNDPALRERMDARLDRLWPGLASLRPLDWQHLYMLEKSANLFGRAAAAALQLLQEEVVLPAMAADRQSPAPGTIEAGVTDPLSLRLLATPIIAHGRWALQSPVTLDNCHPFLDETRQRAIAVNGQFDSQLEAQLSRYLRQVAGLRLRSENSGEYVSLLWGHYFQILDDAQRRYESIRTQNEHDLTQYSIGSQAIDYQVYHAVRGRTPEDLDERAFASGVRQLAQRDGQIAVVGISRVSPRRLYVAGHNRPIFVVRRRDNHDIMVVSDINAAIGLFPQKLIYERSRQILQELQRSDEVIAQMRADGAPQKEIDTLKRDVAQREDRLCADFAVEIFPLEDESKLARIETVVRGGTVQRDIVLADLEQRPIDDIDPIVTTLKPSQVRRDLYASLFVSHQREIPGRLEDILRAYLPEGTARPVLEISHKLFERRFGKQLYHLGRIILVGCGTSFHVALIARAIFRHYLPALETAAVRPDDPLMRHISPERDLVVMVSWSATTADMVELAKMLIRQNVVTVAVTEKKFADLALMISKSGGLIQCLSGEEVTVAAVKSTFCLACCMGVLAVWLAHERQDHSAAATIASILRRLPGQIRELQADPDLASFCNRMAAPYADAVSCRIIDAVHQSGTGREAALKLEETSWTSVSRAIDFYDWHAGLPSAGCARSLVMVNATNPSDMPIALEVMQQLHEQGIAFITLYNAEKESGRIETFSRGQCFRLPRIEAPFQPFLDLVFYYEFAYRYGISHGQTSEGFPRNRAKSVTVGRSRALRMPSPQAAVSALPAPATSDFSPHHLASATPWEGTGATDGYFQHLRRLVSGPDWLQNIGAENGRGPIDPAAVARLLFDDLPPDGHLLLVPTDRAAEAAALSTAAQWNAFLPCGVRVERMTRLMERLPAQNLTLLCGTRKPDPHRMSRLLETASGPVAWMGCAIETSLQGPLCASLGLLELPDLPEMVRGDALYLAFCRLLAHAWQIRDPSRGRILSGHLLQLPELVHTLLQDASIQLRLEELLAANRAYSTAYYVGPPEGSGLLWEEAFDRSGRLTMVSHPFGESVHGPIVTVDHRIKVKYIALQAREAMVELYGHAVVTGWERTYFGGRPIDSRLTAAGAGQGFAPTPFFAEGCWYLPVLRNDYNADQDNLIILDATSRRHFNLALDELSVFGCRHARIAVMTQNAFERLPESSTLWVQPVSHFITLPGVSSLEGTIPELLLPVVRHMVGRAAAGAGECHPPGECAIRIDHWTFSQESL